MNNTHLNSDGFPSILTADMLRNFVTTDNGCTHPRVGEIGGRRFIAKCGAWSTFSSDEHVLNELAADAFLRAVGLNVPDSREYRVDFGGREGVRVIRLAEFMYDTHPLGEVLENGSNAMRWRIRHNALKAYPFQAIIAGIDTFTFDNVRVDFSGNLWFVDNGASFDFRACGLRKGWFWQRSRVDDQHFGYLSLFRHPNQGMLRSLLEGYNSAQLWVEAAYAGLDRCASALPTGWARPELLAYIQALAEEAERQVANLPQL